VRDFFNARAKLEQLSPSAHVEASTFGTSIRVKKDVATGDSQQARRQVSCSALPVTLAAEKMFCIDVYVAANK